MPNDYWPITPAKALRDYRETRDSRAFERIWDDYRTPIARFASGFGLGEEAAEEVRQGVFTTLATRLRAFHYDATRSFQAYLKKLIRTHASDYLAKHPFRPEFDADLLAWNEQDTSHSPSPGHEETLARVYSKVRGRVNEKTWEAYWLIQHERLPPAEAARQLGWPYVNAFRSHKRVLNMIVQEARRELGGGR